MTIVYFVRHAQPDHSWNEDDSTRPLTVEGQQDSKIVYEFLKEKNIDVFYCSPYKRSVETIKDSAAFHKKEIILDERLRERKKGTDGNNYGMFQKRWLDKDFHEDGGESINMVQKRNISALEEIISNNEGKTIVVGTHGTALSSILNYYNPKFGCDDFLRIIDWMPYIIELQFDKMELINLKEHIYIHKDFKGKKRADKS